MQKPKWLPGLSGTSSWMSTVCSLLGATVGEHLRKRDEFVALMFSLPDCFYLDEIWLCWLWQVRSLTDLWVFKPNWEMQSEPWLTVRAYFGFHLLWGHHDITISRQQNTHWDPRSDEETWLFEVSLHWVFIGYIFTGNRVVKKTTEHKDKLVME